MRPRGDRIQLFSDVEIGFTFTTSLWNDVIRAGKRERHVPDARAHRDEAARRVVICRLDDRPIEAAHWLACQRYLENNFQLGGFNGDGQN